MSAFKWTCVGFGVFAWYEFFYNLHVYFGDQPMPTNFVVLIFYLFRPKNNSLAAAAWKITGEDADTSIHHLSTNTDINPDAGDFRKG